MLRFCMHCGKPESEHHEFEAAFQMPAGCVCDPGEWSDNVPPPCDKYDGDGNQYCLTCEHDNACHA